MASLAAQRSNSKMYSCDWLVWLELSTPTNKLATYFGDDKRHPGVLVDGLVLDLLV